MEMRPLYLCPATADILLTSQSPSEQNMRVEMQKIGKKIEEIFFKNSLEVSLDCENESAEKFAESVSIKLALFTPIGSNSNNSSMSTDEEIKLTLGLIHDKDIKKIFFTLTGILRC